ncbi:MAG: phage tail sheath subtilisin-like domain-containing protein [Gammaproteobacteria bacterium]
MSIEFNTIPGDVRVPGVYVEFDSSQAQTGLADDSYTILVIGQRLASGTVAAGVPTAVQSASQAQQFFGAGSMLANMLTALKVANPYTACVAIALDDDEAAVAATVTATITGPATGAGTLAMYIAGIAVKIAVASGDSTTTTATALAAAINANGNLPFTAGAAAGVVMLTARNKGVAANYIDVRLNYYAGDVTPAGVAVAIAAGTAGTTNPDITTAIAAMADDWYQAIAMPYTDSANLAALELELISRWGGTRQIDGIAYAGYRGTASATDTFGATQNSPFVSCMGTSISPTPPWIWAAVYAGVAAASLATDPARPLQTLTLPGILPPARADRFTFDEKNLHLHSGIATFNTAPDGTVQIQREVSTYQFNANKIADTSFLDITTPATLSYFRFTTRAAMTAKFPREKLASDGTTYPPGANVVTPSVLRAERISIAQDWVNAGLMEDLAQFKQDLVIQINATDPNRADSLSSPNLVNQLRIMADLVEFIL